MKDRTAEEILVWLHAVDHERKRRAEDRSLSERVDAVKTFQHARFQRTYADLLAQPTYEAAARFFLDELYGPRDFSLRDKQFARVVPALARLFPAEIVRTVRSLGELHAVSERLDTEMALQIPAGVIDETVYRRAWQSAGSSQTREHQIDLTLDIGQSLSRFTRNPVLRHSLRLMRSPARVAGLGELQKFLERGFDTFREMPDPSYFLDQVSTRERSLAKQLYSESPDLGSITEQS